MSKILAAAAAISALALGTTVYVALPVKAGIPHGANVIGDRAGTSIVVGSKKAVAYYEKSGNDCNVTVLMSETYPEQIPYNLAATRFRASVEAGSTAEVGTSDGAVLKLTCGKDAVELAVEGAENPRIATLTN